MEYHWNKEPSVATKVFDLGLKTFSEDVEYVLNYLDFLISLNDDSSKSTQRYCFETLLTLHTYIFRCACAV